jgi:hypothetical protein
MLETSASTSPSGRLITPTAGGDEEDGPGESTPTDMKPTGASSCLRGRCPSVSSPAPVRSCSPGRCPRPPPSFSRLWRRLARSAWGPWPVGGPGTGWPSWASTTVCRVGWGTRRPCRRATVAPPRMTVSTPRTWRGSGGAACGRRPRRLRPRGVPRATGGGAAGLWSARVRRGCPRGARRTARTRGPRAGRRARPPRRVRGAPPAWPRQRSSHTAPSIAPASTPRRDASGTVRTRSCPRRRRLPQPRCGGGRRGRAWARADGWWGATTALSATGCHGDRRWRPLVGGARAPTPQ